MIGQICGDLHTKFFEMLAILQEACSARKRPAKDGPGENRLTTGSFKLLRMHVSKFSHPFQ